MGSEGFALWGMLFLGLLAGCVVLIIGMRLQLIVGKSCIVSFTGIAGYLLLETVVTIVRAQRMEVNPFSVLTAMAVIFTLALAWNKHKYGG